MRLVNVVTLVAVAACNGDRGKGKDKDGDPSSADDAGYIAINLERIGEAPLSGSVTARFFSEVEPPTSNFSIGEATDPDTCVTTVYVLADIDAFVGEYDYESAGELRLTHGAEEVEIRPDKDPIEPGFEKRYYADLVAPDANATWSVSAEGDEFPKFALDDALTLLGDLVLEAPLSGFEATGAIEVAWSAAGDDPVELSFSVSDGVRTGVVNCLVDDDGAFTIPAAEVDQLPTGPATLVAFRGSSETADVKGRPVTLTVSTTAFLFGVRP